MPDPRAYTNAHLALGVGASRDVGPSHSVLAAAVYIVLKIGFERPGCYRTARFQFLRAYECSRSLLNPPYTNQV